MATIPRRSASRTGSLLAALAVFVIGATAAPAASREELGFLEEAAPLLSPREREVFLGLAEAYQRRAFIEAFWQARNPHPETPLNELRARWEEGLEQVGELFGGLDDDRARVWLLRGPTDDRLEVHCPGELLALEIWLYPSPEEEERELFLFAGQDRRLWDPRSGVAALDADPGGRPEGELRRRVARRCPGGGRLLEWIGEAVGPERLGELATGLQRRAAGWLDAFLAGSTRLAAGARSLPATLEVRTLGPAPAGTAVELALTIAGDCCPELRGGEVGYRVVGEVVRRDRLHDHFRYRFEAAPDAEGRPTLRMERHLPAGAFRLVVLAEAEGTGRAFRADRALEVARVAPAADRATGSPAVTLLPVPDRGPLTGRVEVQAVASGAGIEKLLFLLDNRPVLARTRPPFRVFLDLGDELQARTVAVQALDAEGRVLAQDERWVNVGPHRFTVRLLERRDVADGAGTLRAVARVEPPEGTRVERLDLHVNESRVATLFQPPWVQTLPAPGRDEPTVVRAVAYLTDGRSQEHSRVVDVPGLGERIQVDFVDLFTSVVDRRGRPIDDLRREEVTVYEDGIQQRVLRFERVAELPLHVALLVDTSTSMAQSMPLVEQAAKRLFTNVIRPRDRAALFRFGDRAELVVRFTSDLDLLATGLAGLRAEGWTALHDSIVEALYYMQGIGGRRALILLSDGMDTSSRHAFDEALEYARRAEVTIYTVGIGLPDREVTVRHQLRVLARETGGRMFTIASAGRLDRIYETIERELRNQYLLGYQSSQSGDDAKGFRAVRVEVERDGVLARTIRGYYP